MKMHFKCDDLSEWHKWFAWRPVFVGCGLVWLETIERKITLSRYGAYYVAAMMSPFRTEYRYSAEGK
jgi:hypothetical protein